LVEEIYAAIVVGFDFNIYSSEKGIKMKFNGFNEKLPVRVPFREGLNLNYRYNFEFYLFTLYILIFHSS